MQNIPSFSFIFTFARLAGNSRQAFSEVREVPKHNQATNKVFMDKEVGFIQSEIWWK